MYYLHNRVDNIEACAAHVSKLVPGARIGIAHGKMTEEELNPRVAASAERRDRYSGVHHPHRDRH